MRTRNSVSRLGVVLSVMLMFSCRNDATAPSTGQVSDAIGDAKHDVEEVAEVIAPAAIEFSPAEWSALQQRIRLAVDTVDLRLRKVRGLSAGEKERLRRDLNDTQISYAKLMGVDPAAGLDALIESGELVRLSEANRFWVVRKLDYSVPYLTPSGEAMLVEIAKRFQAKLDTLNLPHYRLDITSVLRTQDSQARLRRANGNASRRESAHEFGTTVDIAYRKFAPPAPDPERDGYVMNRQALRMRDSLMVKLSNTRSGELQALLGRVLQEMQSEGKLLVRMERRQTVYHITVARPLPPIRWKPTRGTTATSANRTAP